MSVKNPWKTLTKKLIYKNPWIEVSEHDVIHPGGKEGIYGVVHYCHLAIGIIPLDDHLNTWLVGQYRYALDEFTWEIPEVGGVLDTPPQDSAERELLEETGIKAKRWDLIQEMQLSNSVSDEYGLIYLARDLSFHEPEPTEEEALTIRKIPFKEAFDMVLGGSIKDSLSVSGLLKLNHLLKEGLI